MAGQNPAVLVLETGEVFTGIGFGAKTDAVFELVFNTSMTGYQEILTDPSYRGQGVLFTVSHLGNVGINMQDYEALAPQVSALAIRSLSPTVSNWRASSDLPEWLSNHGIPGIAGVDTRAIVRKLRDFGTVRAGLSTCGTPVQSLLEKVKAWPGLDGRDMVKEVTCASTFEWHGDAGDEWILQQSDKALLASSRIVLYDFGAKRNILRHLASFGASVTVVPADTSAEEVLRLNPDGIMLSNGPGDPAGLPYAISAVRQLLKTGIPIFGICLGHQVIGLALGGKTTRLKFGHHGGNHPVLNLFTRRCYITAQNHNYIVIPESLDQELVEVTHVSLNDGSNEGIRLKEKPVYSVQFHPEAAPGPHDAHEIFQPFIDAIKKKKGL